MNPRLVGFEPGDGTHYTVMLYPLIGEANPGLRICENTVLFGFGAGLGMKTFALGYAKSPIHSDIYEKYMEELHLYTTMAGLLVLTHLLEVEAYIVGSDHQKAFDYIKERWNSIQTTPGGYTYWKEQLAVLRGVT